MQDPIFNFLLILIIVTILINQGAKGMVRLAKNKSWSGWKMSEFAWKLVFSLFVIPVIVLAWL